ncbi:integrase catalytic domain-containing protein [Trichonephila clavipes]|nr:integrase catalytic domain-containing protein [Trichonephila clavipes]
MLPKKHHSSLCFSGDSNFTSERVIQPSSLGVQKEPETEESSMSQLSAKASVFKPINYIREISKEKSSSQGVGDLFTATSYVKSKSVLLATAISFIRDSFGKMQENTVFGYIVSGSIPVSRENKPHCGLIKDNVDLEKTMRRFWEIENVEPETIKNKETIICSSVVMSDMYIDDVLTGAETLLEAKELKNQLINIFAKGGMVLHKWCGINTELIEVSENYDFSDSSEIKVLGFYWNPKHDCFSFRVKIDLHELNTKRDVFSTIARIYDPLGLLGPVVAKAKIFLQKIWMLKIDWTDLLPDTINREWRQFVESLQVVNDININRCIVVEQPEVIELHGFSDASQSAYGAVVYCKSITSDRKMLVNLIASKSRVAPTK